jgi:hypothetical protein
MIDYKKLARIGLDSADTQKLDELINVHTDPLISQYDKQFIRHGFVEVKDNKYILKMRDDARSVFQITKNIALTEIDWLLSIIKKLLSDDTEERLKKEIDLVRDDAQVQILLVEKRQKELTQINIEHQKLNGKLSVELKEVKADNKKLAEQVDVLTHTPDRLRKKGLM